MESHDAYIATAPEQFHELLGTMQSILAAALPTAEAIVAYNMPGFRENGAIIAGYAAFSKQCGLYVHPEAIAEFRDELSAIGLKPTKTGVTFTVAKAPSPALITALAQASRRAHGV